MNAFCIILLGGLWIFNTSYIGAVLEDRYMHYLDTNSVLDDPNIDDTEVTFTLATKDLDNKIYHNYNRDGKTWLLCRSKKLVSLYMNFKRIHGTVRVPFNVSCEMLNPPTVVTNLSSKQESNTIHLFWNVSVIGSRNYALLWMSNKQSVFKFVNTIQGSYLLEDVNDNYSYQICIATVNYEWRTSRYKCIQNVNAPTPVVNLAAYTTKNDIYVNWNKLAENIYTHEGYVINVTSPNGQCQSIVINMRNYCIKVHQYCRQSHAIRWSSLRPLQISNLIPSTRYEISICSITNNKQSTKRYITVSTEKEDTVSNIRAIMEESRMLVQFNVPRDLEFASIKYRLRVILRKINKCTVQDRIIFDEVINSTLKYIDINYWTNCYDYKIEVTPINSCDITEPSDRTISISYKPQIKSVPQPLTSLGANFLSLNLIKVSWNDPLIDDDCSNFGFLIDLTNVVNVSDCKTWIIARRTCMELISQLSMISKCKNEEHFRIETDVIRTDILLHGHFKADTTYRVQLWTITDDARLLLNKTINYTYKPECFIDCFDSTYHGLQSGSFDGRLCLQWKDFPNITKLINYRSNICVLMNVTGKVPQCIHSTNGGRVNCDVPKCSRLSDYTKCVANTEVLSSRESVTLMWSRTFTTENIVPGYITLLHNTEHECERYHVQGCTDCIKLLHISARIQSLYVSCRSGSITNDLKHETTFDGLQPNKEYFAYIIPLLDAGSIGEVRKVIIGTRVSDLISPINIEITNKSTTTLQFQWDDNVGNANYYLATLVNTKSNYEFKIKSSQEMVTFIDLDICTEYCMSLTVVTKSGQSELIETLCTHTLSTNPEHLRLLDIESGPSLQRTITWKYSDCTKQYRLIYGKKYFSKTFNKITNDTSMTLDNLDRNMIYTVKVRAESNEMTFGEYSEIKEFFTGLVKPTISIEFDKVKISTGKIKVHWKMDGPLSGSMFEFIIRVKAKWNKCLIATNLRCVTCPEPFKKKYLSESVISKLKTLLDCPNAKIYDFIIETVEFSSQLESALGFQKSTLSIYGINLLGLHKLYETDL